ncbi:ABC transporter [Tersicoccus phoenicis]|uniref:ABC transporter n=1 Tax=Tersicoccus phoenicis TaxID=554083 RepID=A0A1R1L809_9MICC|nr:ABC transporter ATP-binding protein [Tersicoccus phoenicis]OMH23685.1 ABC transporter [Tersicoccus phoenicis]
MTFRGVGRSFGPHDVVAGVDLHVAPGEVIAVLGPSGCGKSTLLRLAAGLDAPTTGSIVIGDAAVRSWDRRCAVAFQEPRLLPWRSLRENVALGLPRTRRRRSAAEDARVDELLELVGLADFAGYRPRAVSGGMAQRASLARALARDPYVLLLDEPFGALDALTRLKMQDLLLSVHAASPATILLVTHDVDEALQLADRIVLLGPDADAAADAAAANRAGTADGVVTYREVAARGPAGVRSVHAVPGARPRNRGSADLARIRGELFAALGVAAH